MSIRKKIAEAAEKAVLGKAGREEQRAQEELQALLKEAADQRRKPGDQK